MKQELVRDIEILNKHFPVFRQQYQVKRFGIFGSIRSGRYTNDSDIDVLVEFSEPIGLFKFVALERKLSELLGRKVDLVSKDSLKPIVKDSILKDVVYA